MDERRVDCYIFMDLCYAGYDPYFGTEAYDDLVHALRRAGKDENTGDIKQGIVDLFVKGKDWLILIEDKKSLEHQVKWDTKVSPYLVYRLKDGNPVKSEAENGILHYMWCAH